MAVVALGQKTKAESLPITLASDSDPLVTQEYEPTTLYDGTQAGAAGAAALNSGTSRSCRFVLVQNDPGSAGSLKIGNATSQSIVLAAGQYEEIMIDNVNKIYIKLATASAATANWHAI